MASKVNLDRVEWTPSSHLLESFGDLIEMIVNALIVQDDLRREKNGKPVTGLLEQRTPEKLIEGVETELQELLEGIQRHDRVNEYEEMSDLLMRWVRICRTLELDPELIVKIFFVKARVIAVSDAAYGARDKTAERAGMERLVAEHEGEA